MNKLLAPVLIFFLLTTQSIAGQCQLYFNDNSGLFTVKSNTINLVSTHYVFWQDNWRWAKPNSATKTVSLKNYTFSTNVDQLGLNISGNANVNEPNQLNWQFDLKSSENFSNVIGGGIEFNIQPGRSSDVDVTLLPDNTGWIMSGHHGCDTVTVRFSNPVKSLYFEGNNKHKIRALFYAEQIETGTFENQMSVTLPSDGEVIGTIDEELASPHKLRWFKDIMHPNFSPVDLSFMNAPEIPAGKRGFVKAVGEKLIFEDGTEARFWGTNIQASTLFLTSPSQIKHHAKRLSKLGFNLVRLHHHDSIWVTPNIFGNRAPGTRSLDPESLKRIDMWIKALKDEGIYIWLDLNVGREFTKQDGIENFDEISKNKDTVLARAYNYVNDDIQALLKEFNEDYLNHVNEYTGLAYKEDPSIINVLITNENDLTSHFGNALLPDKNVPNTNKKYMALAEQFAEDHGLSKNQVWRSWEHGVSKYFLNDLEHKFNQKMIDHLKEINLKTMYTTTNSWGDMPISSLPALTDSDLIDVHSYGRSDFFRTNPNYIPNFLHRFGAAHVNGKPLSVSEWNLERFPGTFDRFSGPLYLAATSAFQGWDALMQYGYAQQPLNNEGRPANYTTFNDPASMALMPASALLYRQKHVRQAEKTYALSLSKDDFFNHWVDPNSSTAIRTLMEQSRLVIDIPEIKELPWFTAEKLPANAIQVTELTQNFIDENQVSITSDTGEITRNWEQGIYTVNSEMSQIAMGWLGGSTIELDHVTADFTTKNAAVAVQSIDSNPITVSDNILISLASRTDPSEGNKMPFISEPIFATITIEAKPGLKLFVMNKYGKANEMPVDYKDGHYMIYIDRSIKSYWLMLKNAAS